MRVLGRRLDADCVGDVVGDAGADGDAGDGASMVSRASSRAVALISMGW